MPKKYLSKVKHDMNKIKATEKQMELRSLYS
jgi:hypothetical protein